MKFPDDYINKIICGDCLEVMKGIPDKAVDCVITDPPYGIGFMYERKELANTAEQYTNFIKPFFNEWMRISKDNSVIFIAQAQKYFKYYWEWYGDDIRIFVAAKNFISMRHTFMNYSYDPWVVKVKGDYLQGFKPPNNKDYYETCTASLVSNPHNIERGHPSPKTEGLMRHIIGNFTNPNDLILDSFLGSGTTALASKHLNRRFIGIEQEPKYCEIAQRRLAQDYLFT